MKIYVASSWRNEYQPEVVNLLKELGHDVYDFRNPSETNHGFSWSEIDPNWQNWTSQEYKEALKHQRAEQGFSLDFNAMKWADVCVMVLPCGRSANTEAGWMKGAGKAVYVYQPVKQEPELMYKIYDDIITSKEALINTFTQTQQNPKERKALIIANAHDLALNLIYYDRKEDEDLPVGAIQKAINEGIVTIDDIVEEFESALEIEVNK